MRGTTKSGTTGGMDSGFGAGMHFMSCERMDASNDQIRHDRSGAGMTGMNQR